jgi:hypothetical protein
MSEAPIDQIVVDILVDIGPKLNITMQTRTQVDVNYESAEYTWLHVPSAACVLLSQ